MRIMGMFPDQFVFLLKLTVRSCFWYRDSQGKSREPQILVQNFQVKWDREMTNGCATCNLMSSWRLPNWKHLLYVFTNCPSTNTHKYYSSSAHQRNTLRLGSKASNRAYSFSCPCPLGIHGRDCSCWRQLVTKLRIWNHGSQPCPFLLISNLDTNIKILAEVYCANVNNEHFIVCRLCPG